MAKQFTALTPRLIEFIGEQHIFFVGTAPLSGGGNVNISPKGLDSFRVLRRDQVAYLDLVGSGNETAAHLLENGRITLMFCSFAQHPMILRLYGRGMRVLPGDELWDGLYARFNPIAGERQIVRVSLSFVRTSCGFGVPLMDFAGDRPMMESWARKQGSARLARYRSRHNRCSIDGLIDEAVPELPKTVDGTAVD